MKKRLTLLLLLAFCHYRVFAQTKELIGDLYYNLSGISASVASNFSSTGSGYTNKSYVVPSSVSFKGLEYIVNSIDNRAFAGYNSSRDGCTASSITLSSTVRTIGKYAFDSCARLSKIDLGGTEAIGDYAFSECKNLAKIDLKETQILGDYVFNCCTGLKNVNLGRVKTIGNNSFQSCSSLPSIIIPSSVTHFGASPFEGCSLLREIIYLPKVAPDNWTATSLTYVPDKQSYNNPSYKMNSASVIEMITFEKEEFVYTGQAPSTTWTNNVKGYTASLSMPALSGETGSHEEWIPVTFTKGDASFDTKVVYRYTIKPVKLTAKVTNASREYGEKNPQFKVSYFGLINGENESVITTEPTVTTTATKTSPVGEYPITISGGRATNYEFTYEPGVLTITPAPVIAFVNDAEKLYGQVNPNFSVTYAGLKNSERQLTFTEPPIFHTAATKTSEVGKYTVTLSGKAKNYVIAEVDPGTLTIKPAPLTIKANDVSRLYYAPNPSAYYFSYTGFVNSENEQVLTQKPSVKTDATQTSDVGKYVLLPENAKAKNYDISYSPGVLTINRDCR